MCVLSCYFFLKIDVRIGISTLLRFSDGKATPLKTVPAMGHIALPAGPGAMRLFCLASASAPMQARHASAPSGCDGPPLSTILSASGCNANGTDCLLRLETASDTPWAATMNEIVLAFPYQLVLPQVQVVATVEASDGRAQAGGATVSLSTTDGKGGNGGMALAVVLTTASAGRFTKNVITLMPGASATRPCMPP